MANDSQLYEALSDEDLANLKEKYVDNPSVVTLIEGIQTTRQAEAEKAKASKEFAVKLTKLAKLPPPPADIHNVLLRWAKVEVGEDEEGEVEEVEVDDGKGGKTKQKVKLGWQWAIEVNHACKVKSGGGSASKGKGTREVKIFRHNPNGADEELGTFPSYADFAKHQGILVGADSARRAVERDGYYGVPASS